MSDLVLTVCKHEEEQVVGGKENAVKARLNVLSPLIFHTALYLGAGRAKKKTHVVRAQRFRFLFLFLCL